MALTMTPSAAAATRAVPVDKAGVGSAVLNASRQVGGSFGIAIMGAIVAARGRRPDDAARVRGRLPERASRRRRRSQPRARSSRSSSSGRTRAPAGAARARRRHGAGGVSAAAGTRLPAAERRAAIVEAALRVFSEGSYAGATTAQIAREAGVSEPILYRHFASKRELYFACLDEAWRRIRCADRREDGRARRGRGLARDRPQRRCARSRCCSRASGCRRSPRRARIRRSGVTCARTCTRCTTTSRTSSAACRRRAASTQDRNADAEAWIFVAGTLLVSVADRLGGLARRGRLRGDQGRTPALARRRLSRPRTPDGGAGHATRRSAAM